MDHLIYFLSRVVTILFFVGLLGCVPVVAFSWFSILRNEFLARRDANEELQKSLQAHR